MPSVNFYGAAGWIACRWMSREKLSPRLSTVFQWQRRCSIILMIEGWRGIYGNPQKAPEGVGDPPFAKAKGSLYSVIQQRFLRVSNLQNDWIYWPIFLTPYRPTGVRPKPPSRSEEKPEEEVEGTPTPTGSHDTSLPLQTLAEGLHWWVCFSLGVVFEPPKRVTHRQELLVTWDCSKGGVYCLAIGTVLSAFFLILTL